MALAMLSWIFAIPLLGFLTGFRTLTPIAVLCWFAYAGQLGLPAHHLPDSVIHGTGVHGTWAFWAARPISAIIFSILAVGELIGDKLPMTPDRIAPFPLIARVCFGGLVGALAATGLHGSAIEGAFLGSISALAGAFVGFYCRRALTQEQGFPDLAVAIGEDVITISLSILAMGIITG